MWILINKEGAHKMEGGNRLSSINYKNSNTFTLPSEWADKDTNVVVNLRAKTPKQSSGFSIAKFVSIAESEARKKTAWSISNPEARKYTKPFEPYFGKNRIPWCSAFVYYCLTSCGIVLDTECEFYPGYTYALAECFQKLGQAKNWYYDNNGKQTPQVGDIILFDWKQKNIHEPDYDHEDHIGVCISVKDNSIVCAEGNVSRTNASGIVTRYYPTIQGWLRIPSGTLTI